MPLEKTVCSKLLKRYEARLSERANWTSLWQDVGDYGVPNKNNIFQSMVGGEKKTIELFDDSATTYNRELANALYTLMFNPVVDWFELMMGVPEVDNDIDSQKWFQSSRNKMTRRINESNFPTEIHSIFEDLPSFGTAPLFMLKDKEKLFRFIANQIYECAIEEDGYGKVVAIFKCLKWELQQIVDEFGEKWMDEDMKEEYKTCRESGKVKKYDLIQCIVPWREEYGPRPSDTMKYVSIFILQKKKIEVATEFFSSFPAAVPRFVKLSDEAYGRSPMIDKMPTIKTANSMMKVILQGGQLTIAPPLQMEDNSLVRPLKWKPFGANYRRPGSAEIKPIGTGGNPGIGLEIIEYLHNSLKDGFFINQIRLPQIDRATAQEMSYRKEEQYRSFGAILGRLNNELLLPVLRFVFQEMWEAGEFDPLPDMIKKYIQKGINIKYISMIARAQVALKAEALNRALQASATVIQAQPQVLDLLDGETVLKTNMADFGADFRFLNSDKKVQEIRKGRADAAAQEQEQEAALKESEVLKNQASVAQG